MFWEQTLTKQWKEPLSICETFEKDEVRAGEQRPKFSINLLEWMSISNLIYY